MTLLLSLIYLSIIACLAKLLLFPSSPEDELYSSAIEKYHAFVFIICWPLIPLFFVIDHFLVSDSDDELELIRKNGGWCGTFDQDEEDDSLPDALTDLDSLRFRRFCLRQRLFIDGKLTLKEPQQAGLTLPAWMHNIPLSD